MAIKRHTRNWHRVPDDERVFTLDVFILSGPMTREFVKANKVVCRRIQIRADQTLENLHHTIFHAFDREEEHMYEFQVGGERPNDPEARRYSLPESSDGPLFDDPESDGDVTRTCIGSLGLKEDDVFGYWFDFGDDWWHQITVVEVADKADREKYPKVSIRIGQSPPQYIDLEDEAVKSVDTRSDASLSKLKARIPKPNVGRFTELVALTDAFSDAHLNAEYKALCREMAGAICRKRSLVISGKSDGWAAGIVYVLGQINFLTDPTQHPHVTSADIAKGFGVSVATMHARGKILRERLDLFPLHPDWCLPSKMVDNPYVWLLTVNGIVMDIRMAPREAQVVAFEQGLIPYIPADREM